MKNLFEKVCEIVRPVDVSGINMSNHIRVVRAIKQACLDMSPGVFSALMVYALIKPDFDGLTPQDVRIVLNSFQQDKKLVLVGDIRQGHVKVPAYMVRDGVWAK